MAKPSAHFRVDDGKGRERPEPQDHSIRLYRKDNYYHMEKGGYCVVDDLPPFRFLVLACPFCGFGAPVPTLTKIECVEPLTLSSDITCGNCEVNFYVSRGMAVRCPKVDFFKEKHV